MKPGETILATTQQIDFPDAFRLSRGMFVTYMSTIESSVTGSWLMVLCPDGKKRPVRADEVREHDAKHSLDNPGKIP